MYVDKDTENCMIVVIVICHTMTLCKQLLYSRSNNVRIIMEAYALGGNV